LEKDVIGKNEKLRTTIFKVKKQHQEGNVLPKLLLKYHISLKNMF